VNQPPRELAELIADGFQGYELQFSLTDPELAAEHLQLIDLEADVLTMPSRLAWLRSATASFRQKRAEDHTVTCAATVSRADARASSIALRPSHASPPFASPHTTIDTPSFLLASSFDTISATTLLDHAATYTTLRARRTFTASDDFALMVGATLQAFGVHSRFSLVCSTAALGALELYAKLRVTSCRIYRHRRSPACAEGCMVACPALRRCHAVAEARFGKSTKRLATWLSQYPRHSRPDIPDDILRGGEDLTYRQDAAGFLWLPLAYRLEGVKQQVCGGVRDNYTRCAFAARLVLHSGGGARIPGHSGSQLSKIEPDMMITALEPSPPGIEVHSSQQGHHTDSSAEDMPIPTWGFMRCIADSEGCFWAWEIDGESVDAFGRPRAGEDKAPVHAVHEPAAGAP